MLCLGRLPVLSKAQMLFRKYAQGTLIKEKWLPDWYCAPKSSGCSLFFDSSLVLLFFAATPADVPADTSCTSCLPPLSRYASGEGRNWAGRAGHFLIFRVSHERCHPRSISLCPLLIYVVFSLPFLLPLFSGAWRNECVMNIRGRAASSHVS